MISPRQRYFARFALNFRGAALFRNSQPEIDLGTYSWKGSSRFFRVRIERRERRQNVVTPLRRNSFLRNGERSRRCPGSAIPPIIAAPEITNGHFQHRFASGGRTDGSVVGQAANCFWTGTISLYRGLPIVPSRRVDANSKEEPASGGAVVACRGSSGK